jgi:tetratricopeptide (TPR) repeat protein
MTTPASLVAITMLARSGALGLAWARLEAGGFAPDDPAALTVRGRLLKDRARLANGPDRRRLYGEAAAAYARAATIEDSTYPMINAATLALLGGDQDRARALATATLVRQASERPDGETPYYRGATTAEALLLLGRTDAAREAFAAAVGLAPEAYEDHATTLRQFALIIAEQGGDAGWLDPLRPPRTLHFAGRMGAPEDVASLGDMRDRIAATLAGLAIGAGHGSVAAGADIIIAEALLAHGAALHIVLPVSLPAFVSASVAPWGDDWVTRFEKLLARAASLHIATPDADLPTSELIAFASEIAMGRAAHGAAGLATEAVQLLVGAAGDCTARDADIWLASGRRQIILDWPVEPPFPPTKASAPLDAAVALHPLAVLEVRLDDMEATGLIAAIAAAIPPPFAARMLATGVQIAYADPVIAAAAASRIHAAAAGVRIGGHYAAMATLADPFTGTVQPFGDQPARAARLAQLTGIGATYVSEDFIAGVLARTPALRSEYVGEAAGEAADGRDLRLFALKN